MPGIVVLNPATVDGYGNPISIEYDAERDVNRVFTTGTIENIPDTIIIVDGYGNQISFIRDESKSINRLATSSVVENFPTEITSTDGYGNPISVTRDEDAGVNRLLTRTRVENTEATDGYGNPISITRDEAAGANRLLTSSKVENFPTEITATDGYGNPISVIRDGYFNANRILASSTITSESGEQVGVDRGSILDDDSAGITAIAVSTGKQDPDPYSHYHVLDRNQAGAISIDSKSNLRVRGQMFTDEVSVKDDFKTGTLITKLTGSCSFTNGSNIVVGYGTLFESEVNNNNYIGTIEDFSNSEQVIEVHSNTLLKLASSYNGSTETTDGYISLWKHSSTADSSVGVSNNGLHISSGTTPGNVASAYRVAGTLPVETSAFIKIDNRRINQLVSFGFTDTLGNPNIQALVNFSGTDDFSLTFTTSAHSGEVQSTDITIDEADGTDAYYEYTITLTTESAELRVNSSLVAEHRNHAPPPYETLYVGQVVINTGVPSGNTIVTIDSIYVRNFNILDSRSDQGRPVGVAKAWPIKITDGVGVATILENDDGYDAPSISRLGVNIGSPTVGVRGSPTVIIGQQVPEDFGDYVQSFVTYSGSSDLGIDGSSTPVVFTYDADGTRDIKIHEIRAALTCQDIIMDGDSFCSAPALTNGILVQVVTNGVTYEILNITHNEDWLFFNSPAGLTLNNTGPKDLMSAGFYFGESMVLKAGTSDQVKITIRDDLTGNQMPSYFKMKVFGVYQ